VNCSRCNTGRFQKIRARLTQLGLAVVALTPSGFGKFIGEETEKWAKVVKFAGIKPE
jgi:tripartite-type tricarboxylate transporter receptor subunit TctC